MKVQTDLRTHLNSGLGEKGNARCTHALSESGHLRQHCIITFAGEDHEFLQWIAPGDPRVMHRASRISGPAPFLLLHKYSLQSERKTARFYAQEDLYL